MSHQGRPLRVRKRATALKSPWIEWPKKVQHFRSAPPRFNPFRSLNNDDVLAFSKWYHGETNGRETIRCGLTS